MYYQDGSVLKHFFDKSNQPCEPFDDFAFDAELEEMYVYCKGKGGEFWHMGTLDSKPMLVLSGVGVNVQKLTFEPFSSLLFWLSGPELRVAAVDRSRRTKVLMKGKKKSEEEEG